MTAAALERITAELRTCELHYCTHLAPTPAHRQPLWVPSNIRSGMWKDPQTIIYRAASRQLRSRLLHRWSRARATTTLRPAALLLQGELDAARRLRAAAHSAGIRAVPLGDKLLLRPEGAGRQPGRVVHLASPQVAKLCAALGPWVRHDPQGWMQRSLMALSAPPHGTTSA